MCLCIGLYAVSANSFYLEDDDVYVHTVHNVPLWQNLDLANRVVQIAITNCLDYDVFDCGTK
jgi:hypothetical protein